MNKIITKPVEDLSTEAIRAESRDVDYGDGFGSLWEYFEAAKCEECGTVTAPIQGQTLCEGCGGHLYVEGPMMNYLWPLPAPQGEIAAAKQLIGLPLCIVRYVEDWGLALTGGGMDLSWEIAEAYMRLGYLPPARISLPRMAGKQPSDRNLWIVRGLERSQRVQGQWAERAAQETARMVDWLESQER